MRILTSGNACLSLLIFLFSYTSTLADWTEPLRLTFDDFNLEPLVVARGDTVHVAWYRDYLIHKIYYLRSTDGGLNWDSLAQLSNSQHEALYPEIHVSPEGLIAGWFDSDTSSFLDFKMAYRFSHDGSLWEEPIYKRIPGPDPFMYPGVFVSGDTIFTAYFTNHRDSTGLLPFKFIRSMNRGVTWEPAVILGYTFAGPSDLVMTYCQGILLAVWAGVVDSNHFNQYHVIGYRSSDKGATWSDSIWISPNHEFTAQAPCIACNEETGQIAVGYYDYRNQQYGFHGDIFIAISDDGGLTWPREVQASSMPTAWDPEVDFEADTLVAVWSDMRDMDEGEHEIYFRRSDDQGMTWQPEERITSSWGDDFAPSVAIDGSNIHAVWWKALFISPQESYAEIFYSRYLPGSSEIIYDDNNIPKAISLSAYPNPFNSSTTISINVALPTIISIYDITGRKVESIPLREGKGVWDASPYSSGIYFARAVNEKNSAVIKLIYMK